MRPAAAWLFNDTADDLTGLQLDDVLEGVSVPDWYMRGTHTEAGLEMLDRIPAVAPAHTGRPNRVRRLP